MYKEILKIYQKFQYFLNKKYEDGMKSLKPLLGGARSAISTVLPLKENQHRKNFVSFPSSEKVMATVS